MADDVLADAFTADADVLPVAHPEWFGYGDIVRVGSEAVIVVDPSTMRVQRAFGRTPPCAAPAGESVMLLSSAFRPHDA